MYENNLYLAHGKYVTIVDTQNQNQLSIQHLQLEQGELDTRMFNPFDFDSDVKSLFLMDKTTNDFEQRWRMVVVYNSGKIRFIQSQTQKEIQK